MVCAYAMVWLASSWLAATPGNAEIVVRDPDGKPVANRKIQVMQVTPFPFHRPDDPRPQEIQTDAQGRAGIPLEEGFRRLKVRVPGVGFGGTGTFEVTGNPPARPDLPRLARFASVEGKVDRALVRPGLRVELTHSSFPQQGPDPDDVSVSCDAEGRFVVPEIVPGELHFRLFHDQARIEIERTSVLAEPAQTRRGVVLGPPLPPDPDLVRQQKATLDRLNWTRGNEEITWVEGTVRDTRGEPIGGVQVIVKGVFYGGIRNYSDLRTTQTDAAGRYRIRGPHANFQDAFTVAVRAAGRALLLAYTRQPAWDDKGPREPLDLTVPDRGGTLTVRLLKDGKPLAGAPVSLSEQGLVERIWSRGNDDQRELQTLFNPIERTDDEGVARFSDLYPCIYQLRASEDGSETGPFPRAGREGVARAVIPAVPIAAGEERSMTIALHPEPGAVTLQARRPDGKPPVQRNVTFFFGLRQTHSMTSLQVDDAGIGMHQFSDRGLWAATLQFTETDSPGTPTNTEPYFEGSALLPISPGYNLEEPVKLTCDLHRPGSIRARLVGPDGKPARGTILLTSGFGPDSVIDGAATTDEQGMVCFMDLSRGSYRIRGSMAVYPPPYAVLGTGRFPDDATLRNQLAFPAEEVRVESGTEARVRLQPVKAGYVRGRIKPPPGAKVSEYSPRPSVEWFTLRWYSRRDAESGEYLCGPFLPGTVEIQIHRSASESPSRGSYFVTLAPGDVAHLDLEAKAEPGPSSDGTQRAVSLGMGGLSTMEVPPEAMAGTVFHSDGKTPAFGVRAALMVPKENQPTSTAVSDAAGRLSWTGRWIMRGNSSAPPDPPGQVTTPTVVVSLPGVAGAAVIPIDLKDPRPFRAVLPPPLNVSGRVTLGGQAIGSRNARIRVFAGHQGGGVLDGPLGVEAIVQADGRFVLRGLTPGTCQVQAARDGIWLSRSTTLKIAPADKPAELALDIPEAGAAIKLALVDEISRPAGRRRIKLTRPEGPLGELWPDELFTGADGTLILRGLEVGPHQLAIEGENAPREFQVPGMGQAPAPLVFIVKGNASS